MQIQVPGVSIKRLFRLGHWVKLSILLLVLSTPALTGPHWTVLCTLLPMDVELVPKCSQKIIAFEVAASLACTGSRLYKVD